MPKLYVFSVTYEYKINFYFPIKFSRINSRNLFYFHVHFVVKHQTRKNKIKLTRLTGLYIQ